MNDTPKVILSTVIACYLIALVLVEGQARVDLAVIGFILLLIGGLTALVVACINDYDRERQEQADLAEMEETERAEIEGEMLALIQHKGHPVTLHCGVPCWPCTIAHILGSLPGMDEHYADSNARKEIESGQLARLKEKGFDIKSHGERACYICTISNLVNQFSKEPHAD